MKTIVVNVKRDKFDVYIGRGSAFGNPFQIGVDGDRKEVIQKYRVWFVKRLRNPSFEKKVLKLRGKRLGCYCSPLPCHGDVIKEYLEQVEVNMKGPGGVHDLQGSS